MYLIFYIFLCNRWIKNIFSILICYFGDKSPSPLFLWQVPQEGYQTCGPHVTCQFILCDSCTYFNYRIWPLPQLNDLLDCLLIYLLAELAICNCFTLHHFGLFWIVFKETKGQATECAISYTHNCRFIKSKNFWVGAFKLPVVELL